jgi:ubiquinone/menaquinone biosynthesis C-methylase UbiE
LTGSTQGVADVEQAHRLMQFFRSSLTRWAEFYAGKDLYSVLYRERRITAIQLIQDLNLPAGSLALDVGCGPGVVAVALARKKYVVYATDLLREMAVATRTLSRNAGMQSKVTPTAGDACHLPFIAGAFDLVALIGVTEWVPAFPILSEAARVLKPGGYLMVSWDNRFGLQLFVDPLSNPLLRPLRRRVRAFLERRGSIAPQPRGYTYSLRIFDAFLRACGLLTLRAKTVGFGPFSVLRQPILSERAGQQLNDVLQRLADAQMPVLRSSGRGYVALAQKVPRC